MNYLIFDTETTSLDKPFCYNLGYVIANENGEILLTRDFVIEQVWHNLPLFSSAYYANKRALYVERMRARKAVMYKWGYACREMSRDIRKYAIEHAFAFNASFDMRVFNYNCDWYKNINPLELLQIHDIRNYCNSLVKSADYRTFCKKHNYFTEAGNLMATAETLTQFIREDDTFEEEHTALSDSEIECALLFYVGLDKEEKSAPKINSGIENQLVIQCDNVEIVNNVYTFRYKSKINSKAKSRIILKNQGAYPFSFFIGWTVYKVDRLEKRLALEQYRGIIVGVRKSYTKLK